MINNSNQIKNPRNLNRESKLISGKKLYLVLDSQSYEALKHESKSNNLTMTKFLERILKQTKTDNSKSISLIGNLTNLNKKLYLDTNATFSNINQIAYNLNLNNFLDDANISDEFLKNVFKELRENRENIESLRILILEFLLTLEIDHKKAKDIKEKLNKYQKRLEINQNNKDSNKELETNSANKGGSCEGNNRMKEEGNEDEDYGIKGNKHHE